MWKLLHFAMAAVERAALTLAELVALPLQAPERLAWERGLVERHRAGDRAAFEALYRAYAAALYARVLLPLLRQPALAEDALADTFASAHEDLGARSLGLGDRSLYFWLARIAKNRALDLLRRTALRRARVADLSRHVERLQLDDPDPETALSLRHESEHARGRVVAVLAALPPRYRQAIELRFFEERSRDDCARALAVKVPTFDVLLLRALREFRQRWEKGE